MFTPFERKFNSLSR